MKQTGDDVRDLLDAMINQYEYAHGSRPPSLTITGGSYSLLKTWNHTLKREVAPLTHRGVPLKVV